jgi:hypothetical protein
MKAGWDDRFMLIRDSRACLVEMLADGGVTPGAVTGAGAPALVEVYRRFAAIPADDSVPADQDGDGILAQFGTHDFRGAREFSADFTRQFIGPAEEDAPMWQLSCTLYWDSSPQTDALGSGCLRSFGMAPAAFFAEAVALPGWAWALDGSPAPRALEVTLELV